MKGLVFAGALVAGIVGAQAAAVAQHQKAPIYRYCLQEYGGWRGGGQLLCRFNTLAQCNASKTGMGDYCFVNPQYGYRR